jgi:hypothetical protein
MNPKWLVIAIEMDFYKNIDKLLRDNFKYIHDLPISGPEGPDGIPNPV